MVLGLVLTNLLNVSFFSTGACHYVLHLCLLVHQKD